MSWGWGESLQLAGFAFNVFQNNLEYDQLALDAARRNAQNRTNAQIRNETLGANDRIRGEQAALEAKSYAYDMFEIAQETRRAKASAMAARAQTGGFTIQNYQGHFDNISRNGFRASHRRFLNYGTRLRNIEIEGEGARRATVAQNWAANFMEGPSKTGLVYANLGIGFDAAEKLAFTKDVESGKQVPRWGS